MAAKEERISPIYCCFTWRISAVEEFGFHSFRCFCTNRTNQNLCIELC